MTPKPGYQTTEFWTTLCVAIVGLLNMSGALEWVSNWHGGVLVAIAVGVYNASRGMAKRPA